MRWYLHDIFLSLLFTGYHTDWNFYHIYHIIPDYKPPKHNLSPNIAYPYHSALNFFTQRSWTNRVYWEWLTGVLKIIMATDVKNRLLDSVGDGEGGMIWENSTETCILPHVKQIASPGSMHETGCSGLVHWDDPEGWGGEGGGRGGSGWGTHVHPWLIHVDVWQKPPQYCKVISLQLKN